MNTLNKLRRLYGPLTIILLVTAYFSVGHHHPDEHFQIFEFLSYKIGHTPVSVLPWEFEAGLRSWLAPAILTIFYYPYSLIAESPFIFSFLMRLLCGLFTIYPILKLIDVKKNHDYFYFLIWFLPYIAVRYSSETLSAAFLAWGIYYLSRKDFKDFLLGLLWGASFLMRFQMGVAVAGAYFYQYFIGKRSLKNLSIQMLGTLSMIAVGVLIDCWGYGEWHLSFYNYFKVNILEGVANSFGVLPWYYYFIRPLKMNLGLVNLVFVISFIIFFIKHRKSIYSFTLIPFFLIHIFVGHKELRFIFPAMIFLPIVLKSFEPALIKILHTKWKYFFKFLLFANIIGLLIMSVRPAKRAVRFWSYLYNHNIIDFTAYKEHPYLENDLKSSYYRKKELIEKKGEKIIPIIYDLNNFQGGKLFVKSGHDYYHALKVLPKNCSPEYTSHNPLYMQYFEKTIRKRTRFWAIIDCPISGTM